MAITGEREIYYNIGMKQKKGIKKVFNKFFDNEKFNTIIEIGTGSGAFSVFIAEKANEMDVRFYTFDIKAPEQSMRKRLQELGAIFSKEDVDSSNVIEDLISSEGRVLILNDALKEKHLKKFAKVLKPNDCIISHDYGAEYNIDNIAEDLKKNNLKVCYEKLFQPQFLWLCCIKDRK